MLTRGLQGIADRACRYSRLLLSGPVLAVLVFLVYLRTLAPGVFGFDSAEFSTGAYTLGIVHPPGYPLYLLVAKLFTYLPLGDVAYRLNLMSAVFGALTVLLIFTLADSLTYGRHIAWAVSAFFAFTNYFWQMALIAEAYTLHTFFLALNLLLLLKWRSSSDDRFLLMFSLAYGLSLTNHSSGVLFLPGFALLIITSAHRGWRNYAKLIPLLGLFLLGLAPYLYLPLRAMANPPLNYVEVYYGVDLTTPDGVWWMISGQAYRFFVFAYEWSEIPGELARFVGYLWRNFMGIGVILGIVGLASLWRRDRMQSTGLLMIAGVYAFFFSNYRVMDKDTMFLPVYLVWSLFVAEAVRTGLLWTRRTVQGRDLGSVSKYSVVILLLSVGPIAMVLNWKWVDMRDAHGPRLFAENVFQTAAPDSVILAPWSSAVILEYYQIVEARRPDLTVYNRSRRAVADFYHQWRTGTRPAEILQNIADEEQLLIDREIRERRVYIVGYEPLFASEYVYLPEGSYFQLRPRCQVLEPVSGNESEERSDSKSLK